MPLCLPKMAVQSYGPRVDPCEGLCAPLMGWVASIHLREGETRCWGLCAHLCRGTVFCPEIWSIDADETGGEVGQLTQLLRGAVILRSANFPMRLHSAKCPGQRAMQTFESIAG